MLSQRRDCSLFCWWPWQSIAWHWRIIFSWRWTSCDTNKKVEKSAKTISSALLWDVSNKRIVWMLKLLAVWNQSWMESLFCHASTCRQCFPDHVWEAHTQHLECAVHWSCSNVVAVSMLIVNNFVSIFRCWHHSLACLHVHCTSTAQHSTDSCPHLMRTEKGTQLLRSWLVFMASLCLRTGIRHRVQRRAGQTVSQWFLSGIWPLLGDSNWTITNDSSNTVLVL